MRFRLVRFLIPVIALFAVTTAVAVRAGHHAKLVESPDRFVPLIAPEEGVVSQWMFAVGGTVEPGLIVVRLNRLDPGSPTNAEQAQTGAGSSAEVPSVEAAPPVPVIAGKIVTRSPSSVVKQTDPSQNTDKAPKLADLAKEASAVTAQLQSTNERLFAIGTEVASAKSEISNLSERSSEEIEAVSVTAEKRDKNKALYDLGAVSRKVYERTQGEAESAATLHAETLKRMEALTVEVQSLEAELTKLEADSRQLKVKLGDLNKEILEKNLEPVRLEPSNPGPAKPAGTIRFRNVAPPAIPVRVMVDPSMFGTDNAPIGLDQASDAASKFLSVESAGAGTLDRIVVRVGQRVKKGAVLGWLKLSKKVQVLVE